MLMKIVYVSVSLLFLFIISFFVIVPFVQAQSGGRLHCPQRITCSDQKCSKFSSDLSEREWRVLDALKATTYTFQGVELDNCIPNCELYEAGTLGVTVVSDKCLKPACDKQKDSTCLWNVNRCLAENAQSCPMVPQ